MADFEDLELILDANVDRATTCFPSALSSSSSPTAIQSAVREIGGGEAEKFPEDGGDGHDDAQQQLWRPSHPVPPPLVASLTLAMGSALSLASVPPPALALPRSGPARRLAVGRKPDTSARTALNTAPVVGSAKADVTSVAAADLPLRSERSGATAARFVSAFPDFQRIRDGSFDTPRSAAGLRRTTIVWFRNDLRVHDNEALVRANEDSAAVLPVYCFDPRDYGKSSSGFDKTGPYRAKFLLECVAALRESLRGRGSDLVVRVGRPEEVLAALAKAVGADTLYAHQEVAREEMAAEAKVGARLKEEGVEAEFFWGSTLFHIDDLPFRLDDMPSNYGGFREKVQGVEVRATIPPPKRLKGLPIRSSIKAGDIPSLQDLGLNPASPELPEKHTAYGGALLIGGEGEALQRLKSFAVEASSLSSSKTSDVKKTGDSIYGANFSCKISPWLAMGCLSPRRMFEDLKKSATREISASGGRTAVAGIDDDGLNWLVFELLWRDFFRFITKKFGDGKRQSQGSPATACVGSLAVA